MYNIGTVTTTANSTKLIGTGTKWKDNNSRVSAEQVILIQNGATIYINSIASIQSNTEITLSFPVPASVSNAPYQILTTMVNSVSDAANKIVAMNVANVQFSDILNRWATESGTITVTLPDGTTQQLRTAKEMDKQLDGKLDANYPNATGDLRITKSSAYVGVELKKNSLERVVIETLEDTSFRALNIIYRDKDDKNVSVVAIPKRSGTAMLIGDHGIGNNGVSGEGLVNNYSTPVGFYYVQEHLGGSPQEIGGNWSFIQAPSAYPSYRCQLAFSERGSSSGTLFLRLFSAGKGSGWARFYHDKNTTKDSNGNLKAASPIVKVFADHIETNDEAEGVEMERLGVGHYLIKGVVGFNADGAWGINNGFVIPQDHNGKNMVLIDYKVRPDGDIEVFVFHQQNADLPERFQNKRIKHLDKDGNPVYYENYEPCDVPESRWIDMRVEMPVNSIYNRKQAEAERLAKEEAERQAEEEAKNAEIEVEEDI